MYNILVGSAAVYVDLAYVPHHGESKFVDSEYFQLIHARYEKALTIVFIRILILFHMLSFQIKSLKKSLVRNVG